MRVSTAALYTIAALLAKDVTAPAIASTPPDINSASDLPDAVVPDSESTISLELVTPIAPAELIPTLPAPIKSEPSLQTVSSVKPVAPDVTASTKPATPVSSPEITKAEPASPEAKPSTAAEVPSQAKPTDANLPASSPSPTPNPASETPTPASPAPTLQTVNQNELTELAESGRSNLAASNIQIEPLTEAELAAQQQPIDASTLAGRGTLSLDSLISLNLAEDAIVAFAETETPDVADLDAPLLDHSICEVALNPQQTVPNSICPPSPTVENSTASSSPTGAGEETSGRNVPEVTVSPPSSHAAPPNYSVQSISNGGGSARSYYNLSIRPPAQFSNGNLNLLFPLSIPAAITSAFGWRTHPITGDVRFHSGTDIGAPQGTPVLAAFDGQVEVSDFVGGYGLTVVLQHSNGTEQTLYAHLSEIFVRPGEQVKQGEVIGRVGSTGMSTGPHLHFEFRRMTQEGWTVVNAGPALEYALAQIGRSPLLAQADSQTELPSLFQYSGKFLDLVRVASQDKDKDEKGS